MLHLIALQVSYTTVAAFFSNLLDSSVTEQSRDIGNTSTD